MLKKGIANATGNVSRIMLALVSVPILVRNLGLNDYGLLAVLIAIVNIGSLSEAGLSISTTIHIAGALQRSPEELDAKLAFLLALGLAVSILAALTILLSSPALVLLFPMDESGRRVVVTALMTASLTVVARTLFQVLIGVLHALQRFGAASTLQTVWFYVTQLSLIVLSGMTHNLAAMGAAMAASALLMLLVGWFYVRRHVSIPAPRWAVDRGLRREMLLTTWDVGATNLAATVFNQGDKLVVGAFLAPSQVAVYTSFTTIAVQINALSAAVCQPVLAQISGLRNVALKGEARLAFLSAHYLIGIIAATLGTTLILGLGILLPLLFPTIQTSAYKNLVILIWVYVLVAINAPSYFTLQALGFTRPVRNVTITASIAGLAGIAILTPLFGLGGACLGNFLFLVITIFVMRAAAYLRCSLGEVTAVLGFLTAPAVATICHFTELRIEIRALLLLVSLGAFALALRRFYHLHAKRPLAW